MMIRVSLLVIVLMATLVMADVTTLLPLPKSVVSGRATSSIANGFTFAIAPGCQSSTLLSDAITRYTGYAWWNGAPSGSGTLSSVTICYTSTDVTLQYGITESYTLSVPTTGVAHINATTVYGAMNGMETFVQLIEWNDAIKQYQVNGLPISIADEPRYKWRGLLIDGARHYLPLSAIKKQIDALSYNRMNVLHWHLVDAESFPLVNNDYPQLAAKGAWHSSATYTSDSIATIVAYGRSRGVRVIPEVDIPGHSYSWGHAFPEVVANCPRLSKNINNVALSPASNLTWNILDALLKQLSTAFADDFIHIGGDEVVENCWLDDKTITDWMAKKGFSADDVFHYFIGHGQDYLIAHGRTPIHWQEVFEHDVKISPKSVIQVWEDKPTLKKVVVGGYRALLSAGWYLDKQLPDPAQTWYEFEDTWKNFYANDPTTGLGLTPDQEKLVLGGEAAMWGEQVDAHVIESRIWPRASAIAERLWSDRSITNVTDAIPRMNAHACRMQRRGIDAGPVRPNFCQLPAAMMQ